MMFWELVLRYHCHLGDVAGVWYSGRRFMVGLKKMGWASGSRSHGSVFWFVGVRDGRL